MPKPLRQVAATTAVRLVTPTEPAEEPTLETRDSPQQRIEKRWGTPLYKAGWVALPTIILEKQKALGLDPLDVNILLQIAKHWWDAENLPHPAKKSIAEAIGVDPRTVQRRIAELEKDGLVKRVYRVKSTKNNEPTQYDLSGLVEKATPFAEEALQERARQKSEREARLKRMRPRPVKKGGDASGG